MLREERWKKQFEGPVREKMDALRQGGGAKTSPILEAVQSVSLESFQRPKLEQRSCERRDALKMIQAVHRDRRTQKQVHLTHQSVI